MRTIDLKGDETRAPSRGAATSNIVAAGMAAKRAREVSITRWRVSRLFLVKDVVPPSLGTDQNQSAATPGETAAPGIGRWSADVEVDVRSPISLVVFHAMPLVDQLDHLRAWRPENPNWEGPTREGLAATLQAEVQAHPVCFFENASQFTCLDPVYLTALVRGFAEGLEGKSVSNWAQFFRFAGWVLDQPDGEIEIRDEFSGATRLGRRWQNCRLEIARFLDDALSGKLASPPLNERASVWRSIEVLTRDPDPSPSDEVPGSISCMDPYTSSLNTVRGEALHAVFSFVHWIRSHSREAISGGKDFDDVPEVRAALEAFLDPQLEHSMAVRSVFGANLPRLAHWAEAWLRSHIKEIFPAQIQDASKQAAWDAYLRVSGVDSIALGLLRQQYATAIARMPQDRALEARCEDSTIGLGQHLVVDYCRGSLDLEQPGCLLAAFLARASEPVRAAVLAFVARSLAELAEPISPDIVERLLKLWNWQAQRETTAGGDGSQDEAA